MRKRLVLSLAVVLDIGGGSCRPDPLERAPGVKPPDLAAATPHLIRAYGEQTFRLELRPLLETAEAAEAVGRIENHLRETDRLSLIRDLAYALGALGRPESKRALLKKLGGARGGPNRGGVIFGGSSDQAHYALIRAVAQLEGQTFEPAPDHFQALMDWWLKYPIAPREDEP
ncbi:MAG: hypothetical protein HY293_09420 [Planctomycetes bacterium]|nr:hypothetical protein [Planctomycetota bacterium]